jgi:hypothetical protein
VGVVDKLRYVGWERSGRATLARLVVSCRNGGIAAMCMVSDGELEKVNVVEAVGVIRT